LNVKKIWISAVVIPATLGAVLFGGIAGASAAEPPVVSPITTLATAGSFAQTSSDPATGNSLVVYVDGKAVWGVVVDSSMNVVRAPELISATSPAASYSPPFAQWNPTANNWLVGWDNDSVVYGRLFSATTGALGTVAVLADHTANNVAATFNDIEQVEISYSPVSHDYLVGFKARSNPSGCQEIFGVLVDASGTALSNSASVLSSDIPGPDDGVNCDPTTDNGLGIGYAASSNRWFVGWYDDTDKVVSGRTVGVGSSVPSLLSAVTEFGTTDSGGAPSIGYDPTTHNFVAAWSTNGQLEVNYVSDVGVVASPTGSFISDPASYTRPRLAYDPSIGAFRVVAHNKDIHTVWQFTVPSGSTSIVTPTLLNDAVPAVGGTRASVTVVGLCTVVVWSSDDSSIAGRSSCEPAPVVPVASAAPVAPAASESSPELASTGVNAVPSLLWGGGLLFAGLIAVGIVLVQSRKRRLAPHQLPGESSK
jgi:hypothetical protein